MNAMINEVSYYDFNLVVILRLVNICSFLCATAAFVFFYASLFENDRISSCCCFPICAMLNNLVWFENATHNLFSGSIDLNCFCIVCMCVPCHQALSFDSVKWSTLFVNRLMVDEREFFIENGPVSGWCDICTHHTIYYSRLTTDCFHCSRQLLSLFFVSLVGWFVRSFVWPFLSGKRNQMVLWKNVLICAIYFVYLLQHGLLNGSIPFSNICVCKTFFKHSRLWLARLEKEMKLELRDLF